MQNKHAQELGKLGGKAKSPAKSEASRRNGTKGGRPRKTIFDLAYDIHELWTVMENISYDDKRKIDSYSKAELVHEAKWVLSCYYEGGHSFNEDLKGDNGSEVQGQAKKDVAKLRAFIQRYS
jgi:hypothetical protein